MLTIFTRYIIFTLLFSLSLTIKLYAETTPTFPLKIMNNTEIASNDKVYIFIKAKLKTANGNEACVMAFDKAGEGTCQIVTADTDLSTYSYPLSTFDTGQGIQLNLPKVISGRIYFSIGKPMVFYPNTSNPNAITIPDPDGFKTRDPNYYTLYDKIEFTYTDAGTWINPTAVDFFSIPIGLSQPTSTSGITTSGFNRSSRAQIFSHVAQTFTKYAGSTSPSTLQDWDHLLLSYNGAFQDGTKGTTTLRLIAPGKAMQPKNPLSQNTPFNPNYLAQQPPNFNYIDAVWTHYKTNTLKIDATEINKGIFTGTVDAADQFVFSNGVPADDVTLTKPHSIAFFAGSTGVFDAKNNTPKAIIVREFTSAFDVGLLPAPNNITLNKTYFEANKSSYYTDDSLLDAGNTGPWYDLYSKALHSVSAAEPIYTFAYDDALGQDGTLHDPNAKNIGLVTITLGNMQNTQIPAPTIDHQKYTVYVTVGKGSSVSLLGTTVKQGPAKQFKNVSAPLKVTFNGKDYQIDFAHPMVRPYSPVTDGIVIDNQEGTVNLTFPGKS